MAWSYCGNWPNILFESLNERANLLVNVFITSGHDRENGGFLVMIFIEEFLTCNKWLAGLVIPANQIAFARSIIRIRIRLDTSATSMTRLMYWGKSTGI